MATDLRHRDDRIAALYARVIDRVCERFEQLAVDDDSDEDAARERRRATAVAVQERWREQLTRYTGRAFEALTGDAQASTVREEPRNERKEDAVASTASETTTSTGMGAPHALHQLRAPRSVFATILSGKRKIEQLDGTVEEEGNEVNEEKKDDEADGDDEEDDGNEEAEAHNTTASTNVVVVSPLVASVAPATALNVAVFPLQCAARDVAFDYRKTMLRGRLKNVILTLLRPVRAAEEVAPQQLLWLTRPIVSDQANDCGTLVQVVEVAEGGTELVVQVARSADTHRVSVHETRRLYECVVATGYVQLEFVTM